MWRDSSSYEDSDLPCYDGTAPLDSIIAIYKERARVVGCSTLELRFVFVQHLKGNAREFYLSMPDRADLTFVQLLRRLENRFVDRRGPGIVNHLNFHRAEQEAQVGPDPVLTSSQNMHPQQI